MPEKKTLNEDLFYKGSSANLLRLHTCKNKVPFWDFKEFAVTISLQCSLIQIILFKDQKFWFSGNNSEKPIRIFNSFLNRSTNIIMNNSNNSFMSCLAYMYLLTTPHELDVTQGQFLNGI